MQGSQSFYQSFSDSLTLLFQAITRIARKCFIYVPKSESSDLAHPKSSLYLQKIKQYLDICANISKQVDLYREFEEQSVKLENQLQKYETDIRQRIRIQQQLKLYIQALNAQLDELKAKTKTKQERYEAKIKKLIKQNMKNLDEHRPLPHKSNESKTICFYKKNQTLNLLNKKKIQGKIKVPKERHHFSSIEGLSSRLYVEEEPKQSKTSDKKEESPDMLDIKPQIKKKLERESQLNSNKNFRFVFGANNPKGKKPKRTKTKVSETEQKREKTKGDSIIQHTKQIKFSRKKHQYTHSSHSAQSKPQRHQDPVHHNNHSFYFSPDKT